MAIACYFTIFDFLLDFLQEHVFEVEVERQVWNILWLESLVREVNDLHQ